jgi:hypothetical protein
MDLFSVFYQDGRHGFGDGKLLPDHCGEKLHHRLPATNVSIYKGLTWLKLMAAGWLVMSSKKATP